MPLLVNACSAECVAARPEPAPGHIQHAHTGGMDLEQPPAGQHSPGPHRRVDAVIEAVDKRPDGVLNQRTPHSIPPLTTLKQAHPTIHSASATARSIRHTFERMKWPLGYSNPHSSTSTNPALRQTAFDAT